MAAPLTVRFPDELGERLDRYCEANGCVKNRVVAIAVRSYLGDEGTPALPVARRFDEPGLTPNCPFPGPVPSVPPPPGNEQRVLDELHALGAREVG